MNYRVVHRERFAVIGKAATISLADKVTALPQFWQRCKADGTIAKLHTAAGDNPIMGAGENGGGSESFRYMIGVEAKTPEVGGWDVMEIPESTWVVFEPVVSEPRYVHAVWDYIFGDFLPGGPYRIADTPDLEVNHRTGADSYTCEIWIPVIEKTK